MSFPAAPDRPTPPPAAPAPRTRDVLMLGWEFPPFISGGVGTACYGLTRAMSRRGDRVLFVLPGPRTVGFSAAGDGEGGLELPELENVTLRPVGRRGVDAYGQPIAREPAEQPPSRSSMPRGRFAHGRRPDVAAPADPVEEARLFADKVDALVEAEVAAGRRFDVVHAHDWLTLDAGRRAAGRLKVPLVAHVHSTEHDRNGERADPRVLAAEGDGLAAADAVVCVSGQTAGLVRDRYGLDAGRVVVVHNGADADDGRPAPSRPARVSGEERIVLFVGRLVEQKNPAVLVEAAVHVLAEHPATRFVFAGTGPLLDPLRRLAEERGVEGHVVFGGFVRGEDLEALYDAASALVLPSSREPFGLVGVEALARRVPVILDRHAGAAAAVENAEKIDCSDPAALASAIVEVLSDPQSAAARAERGAIEVREMRWCDAAEAVAEVYAGVGERAEHP